MSFLTDPTQLLPEIHTGDVGTQFICTIYDQNGSVVDLSPATSLVLRFESPSHITTDKTAQLYLGGTTGKMIYIVEGTLFNMAGTWKYQAIIHFASGTWSSNEVSFSVYGNIATPV